MRAHSLLYALLPGTLACTGSTPSPAPQSAAADVAGAEGVVRALYQTYLRDAPRPDLWTSGTLSKGLQGAWDQADKAPTPPPGFDVISAAQDDHLTDFLLETTATPTGARVVAHFKNFGAPTEVDWALIREGGAWKIDDVVSGGQDLRATLAGAAPDRRDDDLGSG